MGWGKNGHVEVDSTTLKILLFIVGKNILQISNETNQIHQQANEKGCKVS